MWYLSQNILSWWTHPFLWCWEMIKATRGEAEASDAGAWRNMRQLLTFWRSVRRGAPAWGPRLSACTCHYRKQNHRGRDSCGGGRRRWLCRGAWRRWCLGRKQEGPEAEPLLCSPALQGPRGASRCSSMLWRGTEGSGESLHRAQKGPSLWRLESPNAVVRAMETRSDCRPDDQRGPPQLSLRRPGAQVQPADGSDCAAPRPRFSQASTCHFSVPAQ